jgi:cyclopropane fatty-acyl-phospholipid synthase-like methyltransferase
MSKIFNLLESIGMTTNRTSELFANSTRDMNNLKVYKDSVSDVIYIDNFFIGDDIYSDGAYREKQATSPGASLEDRADCKRRINDFSKYYHNKVICDFGCGEGTFLSESLEHTQKSFGVELQENYVKELNRKDINCFKSISDIPENLDSCFLFHVLEHLENPISHLETIRSKLADKGQVVIEVPHARDFLIKKLKIDEFIKFTLWSQHLILHTRESLTAVLKEAGFKNIEIHGVQRFSIANHMQWMKDKTPGGHRGELQSIETPELRSAYQESLNKIDATDTLIAIAER